MINYIKELTILNENRIANLPGLMELLTIPKDSIPQLLNAEWKENNHILNPGGRILGIAHIDTVFDNQFVLPIDTGNLILSPRLDDRIGVYILRALMDSIPELTLVLTDNEESGNSTGRHLKPNPNYIGMVEIDRGGMEDSALYQYLNDSVWVDYVNSVTNLINVSGSYTDICDIEIGIPGVNLSAGYYNAHSESCYIFKENILEVYVRAYNFINKLLAENKPFKFNHKKYPSVPRYSSTYSLNKYSPAEQYYCANCGRDYSLTEYSDCPFCGEEYIDFPDDSTADSNYNYFDFDSKNQNKTEWIRKVQKQLNKKSDSMRDKWDL